MEVALSAVVESTVPNRPHQFNGTNVSWALGIPTVQALVRQRFAQSSRLFIWLPECNPVRTRACRTLISRARGPGREGRQEWLELDGFDQPGKENKGRKPRVCQPIEFSDTTPLSAKSSGNPVTGSFR